MTTPKRYLTKARLAAATIGLTIGLLLGFFVIGPAVAEAHTPRPIACQIAWQQAPVGEKWTAKQRCIAAQRRHVNMHATAIRIAKVTRACVRYPSGMGTGMCRAIATVEPAWATSWAYHELLRRESTWDPNAVNDSSDACGAFQRLVKRSQAHPRGGRGCPWAFTVVGWRNGKRIEVVHATPLEQTINGVAYIKGRYGSPDAAVLFHNANNHY